MNEGVCAGRIENSHTDVAIVMPAYNAARFIAEAIQSVRGQTLLNWKLFVVDDNSDDDTATIAGQFAELDSRIRVLHSTVNNGPGLSRNLGLEAVREAQTRWVAFLDSDDLWDSRKLELTLEFAMENESILTYTSYERLFGPQSKPGRTIRVPESVSYRQMLRGSVINSSTVLIDLEQLPNFRWPEKTRQEDFLAWLEILRQGIIGRGVQLPLSTYRIGHQSRSSNKFRAAKEVFDVYSKIDHLRFFEVIWFFSNYAWRGLWKHLFR